MYSCHLSKTYIMCTYKHKFPHSSANYQQQMKISVIIECWWDLVCNDCRYPGPRGRRVGRVRWDTCRQDVRKLPGDHTEHGQGGGCIVPQSQETHLVLDTAQHRHRLTGPMSWYQMTKVKIMLVDHYIEFTVITSQNSETD